MLQFLKKEANHTHTENGAATHITTHSDCLDLFSTIGALRSCDEETIIHRFVQAYCEDPNLALKTLFFARDIRGGLGERRVFRICLKWLAEYAPASARKNLSYVAEFGRWDDLLPLLDTPCRQDVLSLIKTQLQADLATLDRDGQVSLLAKWLPSPNASNDQTIRYAKLIARSLGMQESQYRKTLVKLRAQIRIIENNLRQKDYSFDYAKQPGKAMHKYRQAFLRHDSARYLDFLNKVDRGEARLHADTLMPYELVAPYLAWNLYTHSNHSFMRPILPNEQAALNAAWASLPAFDTHENALAVIDTSGSMYYQGNPLPAAVALSLGLYFAEHNTGMFRNHFIEFSDQPQLIEIKGNTFADRLRYAASFCKIASTNLEAVFDLILRAAVRNRVPQAELPTTLYIISDMEFNSCVCNADATNFENARAKFAAAGYRLPQVVFWNVQSRAKQQPVTMNEQGVALVSGCTPRLFRMLANKTFSPFSCMLEILSSKRYAPIAA